MIQIICYMIALLAALITIDPLAAQEPSDEGNAFFETKIRPVHATHGKP